VAEQGTIHVRYERKVGDGAYGNETAACDISMDWGSDAYSDGYLAALASQLNLIARRAVAGQLAQSAEPSSRRAAETAEQRRSTLRREAALEAVEVAGRELEYWQGALAKVQDQLVDAEHARAFLTGDPEMPDCLPVLRSRVTDHLAAVTRSRASLEQARAQAAAAGVTAEEIQACLAGKDDDSPF